jgi:hypothetical protein
MKKKAKEKAAAPRATPIPLGPHPDAKLFTAVERYLSALSEYDVSARAFDGMEFIKPRPRGIHIEEASLSSNDGSLWEDGGQTRSYSSKDARWPARESPSIRSGS